jgi:hypothetical protein
MKLADAPEAPFLRLLGIERDGAIWREELRNSHLHAYSEGTKGNYLYIYRAIHVRP